MLLRPAQCEDALAVAALNVASWRSAYRDVLTAEYLHSEAERDRAAFWHGRLSAPEHGQRVDVLEESGQIIGFSCVLVGHDPALGSFLHNLHVAPLLVGRGLGAMLMGAVRQHCLSAAPSDPVFLWVVHSNDKARGFYAKLGAMHDGEMHWQPPGGGSALLYRMSWRTPGEIRAPNNSSKPTPLRGAA